MTTDYVGEALSAPRLEVLCLANVTPRAIDWLWPNWLALGKTHVLAGNGGVGKSTVLCDLAARTTNGEPWPDNATNTMPGDVLILAAEDDVEDTLAPRLIAVGADRNRIHTVRAAFDDKGGRRSFNLAADLANLEVEINRIGGVRLVIIDPVSSYLGKVDSHKNAEVRSVLEPLGEMASRLKVAVVCNNHFSKGGGDANSRVIGSVAFVNQARAAFIVTPDAEDPDRLLLCPSKMNLAPIKTGLAYRIEGCTIDHEGTEILTSRVGWESTPVTMSANEALAALAGGDEAKTQTDEAIEFLRSTLAAGAVPAADVQSDARAAGISAKALRTARERLGVKPEKSGFNGGWVWPGVPQDAL